MKAVIQIVNFAKVEVENKTVGKGDEGLLVLLGVYENDTKTEAEILAKKISNLRIFNDENDKMNLSVLDIRGSILTVSNFTLCADTRKGNRPSYTNAKAPREANDLYLYFVECLKQNGVLSAEHGEFGTDMQISTQLSGPVTIILDTDTWSKAQ